MRQELRDRTGKLLGYCQQVGRRVAGYDRTGLLVGWYDPIANVTRDKAGLRMGSGDFLASLIVERQ